MTGPLVTTVIAPLVVLLAVTGWLVLRRGGRSRSPKAIRSSRAHLYRRPGGGPLVGIVTGDLRNARCAEVWVNSENTEMRMARIDEYSVSSIIRYEGARRDATGRVVQDVVADELERKVGPHRPVPAGTAVVTGSGELVRFGVRYVAHTAAVQGEPGAGYRQVRDIGRCASEVLAEIDRLVDPTPVRSVLFPLLGVGQGGGDPRGTALTLAGAVLDYLTTTPGTPITTVFLLAYTDTDLAACRAAFARLGLRRLHGLSVAAVPPVEATALPVRRTPKVLQVGVSVDIVGYGLRTAPARDDVQRRLVHLLRDAFAEVDIDIERTEHEWVGDGAFIYLPQDADLSRALVSLVTATNRRLREDNRVHDDRVRLRMAITAGLVGPAATGYSGPLAVDLARMTDAAPLREAITATPGADLAVLLSDYLHSHVLSLGYGAPSTSALERVDVTFKEFAESAWLWLPSEEESRG